MSRGHTTRFTKQCKMQAWVDFLATSAPVLFPTSRAAPCLCHLWGCDLLLLLPSGFVIAVSEKPVSCKVGLEQEKESYQLLSLY